MPKTINTKKSNKEFTKKTYSKDDINNSYWKGYQEANKIHEETSWKERQEIRKQEKDNIKETKTIITLLLCLTFFIIGGLIGYADGIITTDKTPWATTPCNNNNEQCIIQHNLEPMLIQ